MIEQASSLQREMEEERLRQFVGRARERAWLKEWLNEPGAPTGIAWVTGMGGIGKTALLQVMRQEASQSGAAAYYMDARACTCSPSGLLEYLALVLAPDQPGRWAGVEALHRLVTEGRRVILALDNTEALSPMEGWIREELCARLPLQGALLLCASRRPGAGWLDSFWRQRLHPMPLAPLSLAESRALLATSPLSGPIKERLLREAGGHPLSLSLGAAMELPALPALIAAGLLQEVSDPDLHPLLDLLAVLPAVDQDELAELNGQSVTPDQFLRLAQLSFVTRQGGRLGLQDVARESLLADLAERAPRHLRLLRRRAADLCRSALRRATTRLEEARLHATLLALAQDGFPAGPVFSCRGGPSYPLITSAGAADRDELQAMLAEWGRIVMGMSDVVDEHQLLDALLERSPESIRVLRAPDGAPLAFLGVVLLHRESVALLEGFRLGQLYLQQCPPEERARLECPPEEADSYYGVMGGMRLVDGRPGPDDWINVLFRDHLACLGERRRLLGLASNPGVLTFLQRLGYRQRSESLAIGGAPWPFRLVELDLRDRDFADWVISWLEQVERQAEAVPSLTAEVLTEALALLQEPRLLERSGLAALLRRDGTGLQALLLAGLGRLNPDEQRVLTLLSASPHLTPDAMAARLHLSRATYYRRRRSALVNLATWLGAVALV